MPPQYRDKNIDGKKPGFLNENMTLQGTKGLLDEEGRRNSHKCLKVYRLKRRYN